MRDTLEARDPCEDMLEIGDSGAGDVAAVACALLSGVRIIFVGEQTAARELQSNDSLRSSIYHPLGTALH